MTFGAYQSTNGGLHKHMANTRSKTHIDAKFQLCLAVHLLNGKLTIAKMVMPQLREWQTSAS